MALRTRIVASALILRALPASGQPLGCFVENWVKPTGALANIANLTSATDCQQACAANETCDNFGWYTGTQECWFGTHASEPYVRSLTAAIAGPQTCVPEKSACDLGSTAPEGWPLVDEEASMNAWPGQFQPQKLSCTTESCPFNVGNVTVLEDTLTGWPGACTGLTEFTSLLGPGETCESSCQNNVSCPVYQLGLDGTCWQGIGLDCTVPPLWNATFQPVEAKRFQRGGIHVMRQLTDVQIMDLMQVFGPEELASLGQEKAIVECKHICYSIYGCQYWQLSNVTAAGGCWVEGPADPVTYPLYRGMDGLVDTSSLAGYMIAGEYIKRYCPDVNAEPVPVVNAGPVVVEEPEPVVDVETEDDSDFSLGRIIGILAALLCCIALCVGLAFYMGLCGKKTAKKDKRPKKKRGAQPLVQSQPANLSLFDQIDSNHDGVITKEEFMRSVQVMPVQTQQPMQAVSVSMPAMQYAQPVPTVAMQMPTYQVAGPAPMAAQQMTYAAPGAAQQMTYAAPPAPGVAQQMTYAAAPAPAPAFAMAEPQMMYAAPAEPGFAYTGASASAPAQAGFAQAGFAQPQMGYAPQPQMGYAPQMM